jgi:hypothetical protein
MHDARSRLEIRIHDVRRGDPSRHARVPGELPAGADPSGVIQSAVHLELCERHDPEALQGTHAYQARYGGETTGGLRALWAAFKQTGRVGRLRSSRASMLPDNML